MSRTGSFGAPAAAALAACVTTWLCFAAPPATGQGPASHAGVRGPAEGLIVHSVPLPDGRQQLSVVDSVRRVIAVYHVDPSSGKSTLKSVRNINWDLDMFAFNTDDPQPQEIRTMLPNN